MLFPFVIFGIFAVFLSDENKNTQKWPHDQLANLENALSLTSSSE